MGALVQYATNSCFEAAGAWTLYKCKLVCRECSTPDIYAILKQAGRVLRAGGEEDGDGDSDSSDEMTQTLLEIDYETIIDDEDVVDEFCIFRSMLEGILLSTVTQAM